MELAETLFRPKPGLIETDLEHELILLDPDDGEMFSLNPTGRTAWRALHGSKLATLVNAVVEAFEVEPAEAERDLRVLLRQLLEAGLIVPEADDIPS